MVPLGDAPSQWAQAPPSRALEAVLSPCTNGTEAQSNTGKRPRITEGVWGRARNQPQVRQRHPILSLLRLAGLTAPCLLSRTPWAPCPSLDIHQPGSDSPFPSPTLLPHSGPGPAVQTALCQAAARPCLACSRSRRCSQLSTVPRPFLGHMCRNLCEEGDLGKGEAQRCRLGTCLPRARWESDSLCLSI